MSSRAEQISALLEEHFQPVALEIIDDSWKHAGHAGAKEHGGGHFSVEIVSENFAGKSRVQRHRMVYTVLEKLFGPTIHAVNIHALSPEEK
ncbi:MAG: BolA family transcriptional regulator [Mariprofundaceae bacterium]|nr:BolA family transcriptional regulator [Mariprofundaceae bacterium]